MSATPGPASDLESLDSDERVGKVLADRYRLDALLGEGGMGRVYEAEHVLMKKRLAVKVLHRELTRVPEVVARFEREAMAAANIDHPNVAAATDFGKLEDGAVFLVLEFVSGKNLRDEIAAGPFPPARAAHITRQIASALEAAHGLEIVHRDLKPENVMLIERGGDADFVKVLDFGVAKVPIGEPTRENRHGNPITKAGMVFGTPEYMAPEQALGQPVDGRADLYALGVIFFEMLTGVRPFVAKSSVGILGQQLSKPPPTLLERCPGIVVPPRVEAVVMKLLAKEAHERYANATDVINVLNSLLGPMPSRLSTSGGPAIELIEPRLLSIPDLEPPPPDSAPPSPSSQAPFSEIAIAGGSPVVSERGVPRRGLPGVVALRKMVSDAKTLLGSGRDRIPKLYDWVDARREALPPKARDALRSVPTPALLWGSLGLFAFGTLGVLAIMISLVTSGPKTTGTLPPGASADSRVSAPAAPEPASTDEPAEAAERAAPPPTKSSLEPAIAEAKKSGSVGLVELAAKNADDPRVLVELAQAYVEERKYGEAVKVVQRVLERDPSMAKDKRVKNVLHATAQMPASIDATFTLLDGPMAERGADVMYSLMVNSRVHVTTRNRAEKWLEANHERKATKAVSVAFQLYVAKNCPDRHGLLPNLGEHGDTRALSLLRELEKTTGCGPGQSEDCYPCLRGDDQLKNAIAAIEKRYPKR